MTSHWAVILILPIVFFASVSPFEIWMMSRPCYVRAPREAPRKIIVSSADSPQLSSEDAAQERQRGGGRGGARGGACGACELHGARGTCRTCCSLYKFIEVNKVLFFAKNKFVYFYKLVFSQKNIMFTSINLRSQRHLQNLLLLLRRPPSLSRPWSSSPHRQPLRSPRSWWPQRRRT